MEVEEALQERDEEVSTPSSSSRTHSSNGGNPGVLLSTVVAMVLEVYVFPFIVVVDLCTEVLWATHKKQCSPDL